MAINSKDIETLWNRYSGEGFKEGVFVCVVRYKYIPGYKDM